MRNKPNMGSLKNSIMQKKENNALIMLKEDTDLERLMVARRSEVVPDMHSSF